MPYEFRVVLGFWVLDGSFGFWGFLWAFAGFPMYTLCVLRGVLRFFDIYNITFKNKILVKEYVSKIRWLCVKGESMLDALQLSRIP